MRRVRILLVALHVRTGLNKEPLCSCLAVSVATVSHLGVLGSVAFSSRTMATAYSMSFIFPDRVQLPSWRHLGQVVSALRL